MNEIQKIVIIVSYCGENGHLIPEVFEIGSFNTQVLLAHTYSPTNS